MKLIVEIETRDDKTTKHECVDFPSYASDFITLYKPNFRQEKIRVETVAKINQYFK